ncbi:MAG: hypothetical protein IH840_14365 [Candidatus Heimdallarchaeota archaeon]|nr:hypothetical protein [Candidatus Heimdallarchaeota archaeon]
MIVTKLLKFNYQQLTQLIPFDRWDRKMIEVDTTEAEFVTRVDPDTLIIRLTKKNSIRYLPDQHRIINPTITVLINSKNKTALPIEYQDNWTHDIAMSQHEPYWRSDSAMKGKLTHLLAAWLTNLQLTLYTN